VVTNCKAEPKQETPVKDLTRFNWREITKVERYRLGVDSLTKPMQGRNPLPAPESADGSQEGV
jgi:hypothetical protein